MPLVVPGLGPCAMLEYWPEMLYSGIRERCWLGSPNVLLLAGLAILRGNGVLIEYIVRPTAALGNTTSLTPETPTSKEERALGVSSTRW